MSFYKNSFDFLRFIFAFIVVLGHLVFISQQESLQFLAPFLDTHLSVTGFFVISGFLISKSYLRTPSVSDFYIKRAKRLLPAYFLVVLLCAFFLVFLSDFSFVTYFQHPYFWRYLLANLSFLNFLQPCLPGVFSDFPHCAVNASLWTIKVEVMFYLSVPIIIWIYKRTRFKKMFFLLIYVFSVLYRNGLMLYGEYTGNEIFVILARQLPGFISYFIIGIAINLYFELFVSYKNKLIFPALLVFLVEYFYNLEILTPLVLPIIILYVAFSTPILNKWGKYGDISYGIYIYHFPIFNILITCGIYQVLPVWIAFLSMVLIVIVVGFLSWHFVEKPILNRRVTR